VRAAHCRTGIAAADFLRIRNADLGRFTTDRLISIINRLGSRVDVKVRIRRVEKSVVLEPSADDPETWLAELKKIPADSEFMKERRQPKTPKRTIFK
jgi:virulence-associated protein VagC